MQRSRENRETKKQRNRKNKKQEKQRNRGSKKQKNREAEKQETQRNNVSGEAEKQISRKAEKRSRKSEKQESIEPGTPEKIQDLPRKKTKINSPQSNKYQLKSHSYHRHSQEVTLPSWVAPSTRPVQNWNEIVGQIPGTHAVLGLAACHTDPNQNSLQVCRVDQTPYHHELTVPLLGSIC